MSIAAGGGVSWLARPSIPAGPVSSRAAGVLRQIQSNSLQHFGHAVAIEPLAEVMGTYSRVVRARLHLPSGSVDAYVKLYEPRQDSLEEQVRFRRYVVTEYERTRLARLCATPCATVPAPLACLPDELLVITQEAAGVPLQARLRHVALVRTPRNTNALVTDLRRTGEWLRAFQQGVPVFGKDLQDFREYLDIRLRRLVAFGRPSFTESERRAFLDAHDDSVARMTPDEFRWVSIHADLCPSNILVRDDAVTVIDFAASTDGARCWDVAHLVMHVRYAGRRFGFGRRLTSRLVRALLDGFDPALDERHPAFRFAMLPQVACYLNAAVAAGVYDRGMLPGYRFRRDVALGMAMAGLPSRNAH